MQTFDAVDGKQARRTNSSSPLGELFDHGCDALACAVRLFTNFSPLHVPIYGKSCELIVFILYISLRPWLLEARQCVEKLPSGIGSLLLSHFTAQPGNSEFMLLEFFHS
jgi:phosphatidylglycerophosphate synthase